MHLFHHLATVCRHRRLVRRHARKCGITWQGIVHDLSKFSPTEFFRGVKYWEKGHSPTEAEREAKGYSLAWMHHKGRNKHHWEFWTDLNPSDGSYSAKPMPTRYVAEMFCDRIAASKTYLGKAYTDGAALHYLNSTRAQYHMHPETLHLLRTWLTVLAEEGEKAAFSLVKQAVKNSKRP